MQTGVIRNKSLHFLEGGGEMGKLIREQDWQATSLGTPDQWPQGLQTTLGILLHSAFPMFLFWGPDLVSFYNDAFRPSLGNEGKHPSIGKKGKEVWPEIWDFIGPLIDKVLVTGEPVYYEDQLVPFFRNGKMEDIYWTFSYSPAYGDNGRINGVLVTCMETTQKVFSFKNLEFLNQEQIMARQRIEALITERTNELAITNEALLRSNRELERSNSSLEEFAFAASHDLKDPIRKIHFFSERLKSLLKDRLSDEEWKTFERLETSARRMGKLVDDLLTYSMYSLQSKDLEKVSLGEVVSHVLGILDMEIEQKNVHVEVGELPEIEGNRMQLQQAFQNLVGNAVKYCSSDKNPRVRINSRILKGLETGLNLSSTDLRKDYHAISIEDNGIGFENTDAEKIFDLFTRLHGNAEYKGSGIGLSIVRKVVENHHGYIRAESRPGEGAIFALYLPVDFS